MASQDKTETNNEKGKQEGDKEMDGRRKRERQIEEGFFGSIQGAVGISSGAAAPLFRLCSRLV